jgi:two-component sensor histidine kinase
MIRARQTCFCGEFRAPTIASSRALSEAVTEMLIPVRITQCRTSQQRRESPTGLVRSDQSTSIADGEDLVLTWLEHGGPKVIDPVGRAGFGSKLVQRTVIGQLGGTIEYDWAESGLVVTLHMDRGRLAN